MLLRGLQLISKLIIIRHRTVYAHNLLFDFVNIITEWRARFVSGSRQPYKQCKRTSLLEGMFCILIYFLLALRDNLNSRLSTKCCAWLTTKYDCRTPLTALRRNLPVLSDSHRSQSEIGPPAMEQQRLVAWYRLASLNYISMHNLCSRVGIGCFSRYISTCDHSRLWQRLIPVSSYLPFVSPRNTRLWNSTCFAISFTRLVATFGFACVSCWYIPIC